MKTNIKTFVSALMLLVPLAFSMNAFANGDRDWDREHNNHDWDKDSESSWNNKWSGSWKKELDDWKKKGWGYSNSNNSKVFICHRTGSSKNPYVLLQVSASAKQSHLNHGDSVQFSDKSNGKCGPNTPPPPPEPRVSLSLAASEIFVGATTTATWTSSNATSCTLTGHGPSGGTTVAVNSSAPLAVGPYQTATNSKTISITCTGAGGKTASDSETLKVKAAPKPTVSLKLAASEIFTGATTTATWTSSNATSCTLTGHGPSGSTTVAVNSSAPLVVGPYQTATNSKTISINCTGAGGSASDSETLKVKTAPVPPTVSMSLEPSQLTIGSNGKTPEAKLSWSSTNATKCTLSGTGSLYSSPFSITIGTSGSYQKGPFSKVGEVTYTIKCDGPGGSDTKQKVLKVVAPAAPTVSVSLDDADGIILVGESTKAKWTITNATSCTRTITGASSTPTTTSIGTGNGEVQLGSYSTPRTVVVTIKCKGANNTTAEDDVELRVNALPPLGVSLDLSQSVINEGDKTTVSWEIENATSATACTLTVNGVAIAGAVTIPANPANPVTGSKLVGPYRAADNLPVSIACTGTGGATANDSASLKVNQLGVSLELEREVIDAGETTTVDWTVTNASSTTTCVLNTNGVLTTVLLASAVSPTNPVSGSESVGSSAAGTGVPISINCTSAGGATASDNTSLTVNALLPLGVTLEIDLAEIYKGEETDVSWTITNAKTGTTMCSLNEGGVITTPVAIDPASDYKTVGSSYSAGTTTTITLSCNNGPGTTPVSAFVTLKVVAPPPLGVTLSFSNSSIVQTKAINPNESTTVYWTITNAGSSTTCSLDEGSAGTGGVATTPATGSAPVGSSYSANTSTLIIINCDNGPGTATASASVTLSVNAWLLPTISLSLALPSISSIDETTTANWTISNATTCSLQKDQVSTPTPISGPNGIGSVQLGTYPSGGIVTVTIVCTGPGGDVVTKSVDLNVTLEICVRSHWDNLPPLINGLQQIFVVEYDVNTGAFSNANIPSDRQISGQVQSTVGLSPLAALFNSGSVVSNLQSPKLSPPPLEALLGVTTAVNTLVGGSPKVSAGSPGSGTSTFYIDVTAFDLVPLGAREFALQASCTQQSTK